MVAESKPPRFTTKWRQDGAPEVFEGDRLVGYATKGGPFHLWSIVFTDGRLCGAVGATLADVLHQAAQRSEYLEQPLPQTD